MVPDPTTGKRIALFTFPIRGHLVPVLPVVAELSDAGHRVTVATTAAYAPLASAAGADVAPYPAALSERLTDLSDNFLKVASLLAALTDEGLLAFAIEELQRLQPDVVLLDSMAPWGRLAAEILGVPAVTSTASFVIDARLAAAPRAAADAAAQAAQAGAALVSLARHARSVRRRHGVALGGPLQLLSNRVADTLVYTSRALQPGGQRLRRGLHFVGATGAERRETAYRGHDGLAALLAEPPSRPLAYVSLGTIYHDRPQFIRNAIAALAGAGRNVVVSVVSDADVERVGPVPDGVLVCPLPPQLALLDRAELFVTHGGLNSVHEALWRGVPMVVFPQAADQPVVAARLQALGAGAVLRGREPSVDAIRTAAQSMLRGDARVRAAALGVGLRDGGGASAAAAVVLSACVPPRSRPGS